jgi:hypothetical protein
LVCSSDQERHRWEKWEKRSWKECRRQSIAQRETNLDAAEQLATAERLTLNAAAQAAPHWHIPPGRNVPTEGKPLHREKQTWMMHSEKGSIPATYIYIIIYNLFSDNSVSSGQ